MSLSAYQKKRSPKKTPEPFGGKPKGKELLFVVQKHDASHLHYDFRLQMDGVLKSWAVPKGPSMDPSVKRLAMMVEDHPYDYHNFEGIIPKGEYGGGTVIVWDQGVYAPAEAPAKKINPEKYLLQQLKNGKIVFNLNGEKLKGAFALVKSGYRGENAWLLMKVKDKYAKKTDITKKDKSVISGKTIPQMEKAPDKVYGHTKKPATTKKKAAPKKTIKAASKKKVPAVGKKAAFPASIAPMLATLVDKPFDAEDWLYEIKWDGYRAVAHLRDTKVGLWSRNQKSFDEKFYPIHAALQTLGLHAVLDGEIIVSTPEGISNFGMLQNWRSEADGQLLYYVFDLLWLDGYSLLDLPLTERRALLEKVLPAHPLIRLSEAFATSGLSFYQTAKEMKLEGIMAKKADSVYVPGERSKDWLKIKVGRRQEVVIGGYTKNEGSAKSFSALLVGVFKNKKLQYTGKIGTGFSDQLHKEMLKKFAPLVRKTCPFTDEPDVNKPSRFRHDPPHATAVWLKPQLVCEVAFTEMTTDGVMRHPSFEGMREDKPAQQVVAEKAAPVENMVEVAAPEQERNTLLNPSEEQQQRKINGHPLKFTNLSKLFWPKEKISKRDMLNYYYQVAPYMLPYLKNRPQSLNRHPGGINAPGFYQKDITGKAPDWIKTFPYTSEGRQKNFLVCTNEASLLYMASLGCIEINPWSSTVLKPQNPDWCIIDLDPTEKNSFDQVIETAQATHALLEAATVDHYCKTSGSTGIHIYIPLGAKYDYEASKEFGRLIAKLVHEALPEFTSIERATKQRRGKIYIDFLQNRPQATLAAPYSLRPKPGAIVSMPLRWEEVKKGLRMSDFNIHNAVQRIRESDDIFKPVLGKGIDMKKAIQSLVYSH